jgi:uncharacterized protein YxjI
MDLPKAFPLYIFINIKRKCYSAEGELFSWGKKLHVYSPSGEEVAFIQRKLWTWLQRYIIQVDGAEYTLVKEFSFLRAKFRIEGLPWTATGNFWEHEYSFMSGTETIMNMRKQWFTWGDSYELNIADGTNPLLCLCLALSIDCMLANEAQASSSTN